MAKLKLSKKGVKAVKDSIAHWKRDILAKLKKGIAIKEKEWDILVWADNGKEVKCRSSSCPLCRIYYDYFNEIACFACPYYKKYRNPCTQSDRGTSFVGHWRKFRENLCLKTCNGMIESLENILK